MLTVLEQIGATLARHGWVVCLPNSALVMGTDHKSCVVAAVIDRDVWVQHFTKEGVADVVYNDVNKVRAFLNDVVL